MVWGSRSRDAGPSECAIPVGLSMGRLGEDPEGGLKLPHAYHHSQFIMSWYYAQADESKGPIPEPEFLDLVRQGVIQPTTLVWREGMAQWVAWGTIRSEVLTAAGAQPGATIAPLPPGHSLCVACRQTFPDDDLVVLDGRKVCAACKPVHLQKIQEGAAGWTPGDGVTGQASGHPHGDLTPEEILNRDYDVPVVELISAAGSAVKAEPAPLIVSCLLILLVSWGIQLVTIPFQLIPFVGQIIGMILPALLTGPLFAGLFLTFLRHIRGEKISAGDVFCGFGPRFRTLAMAYFVPTFLSLLLFVPSVVLMLLMGFSGSLVPTPGAGTVGGMPNASVALLVALGATSLVAGIVYFYLTISWIYTVPLVADRKYGYWEAMTISRRMVSKHFWQHLWFLMFCGIINFIGVLACCVGIVITVPIIALAATMLYERLFQGMAAKNQA